MNTRRRGYSLIECLVMFVLVGTALSAVSLTLHGLRRADRRLRDEFEDAASLVRFTDTWRHDVHGASRASIADQAGASGRLQLASSEPEVIEYSLAADHIERKVRRQDQIVHRDSFRLPLAGDAVWQFDGKTVVLNLHGRGGLKPPVERLVAAVGIESEL